MLRLGWLPCLLAAALAPAIARSASLIVDRLGTPDVVQAGDRVSFSFALEFGPDEILLATQAAITAPQLGEFQFAKARGPWDLSADFRLRGDQPMWVYAENIYGEDAPGVTWDEVGGRAPLGSFSAVATWNGEIEFLLSDWTLLRLGDTAIPLAPEWAHIRTGVTIVGGADLPPPPPPPVAEPPVTPPPPVATPVFPEFPTDAAVLGQRPPLVFHPVTQDLPPDYRGRIPRVVALHVMEGGVAFYPADAAFFTTRDRVERRGGTLGAAVPEPGTGMLVLLGTVLALRRRRSARRSPESRSS